MTAGTVALLTRVTVAFLVAAALVDSTAWAQSPRRVRTVLTVYWSAEDFPNTPIIDAALRRTLISDPAMPPVDYYAEYLESDRFPSKNATLAFRDYLRRKYQGRRIDLVIAVAQPALDFILENRDLFPRAPVVASLVTMPDTRTRHAGAGITGVISEIAYDKTLELALTLHPSTTRVFVVAYAPLFRLPAVVDAALRSYSSRVQLTYIEEPSVERLVAAVRRIPAGSLLLYVRYSQERQGNVLYPDEVARILSEASPVPVYGQNESYIGHGVVGGVVRPREYIGTRLAQMAQQIFRGTRASAIPMEPNLIVPNVDWRQMRRWNINPALLPPGTIVRFREPTAWELYRWYIAGASALMLVQGGFIAALIVQRRKRRRFEAALIESQVHFRIMADSAPVMIWRTGSDKQCDFVNLPFLTFTGRSLPQELGRGWMDGVHPDDRHECATTIETAFDAREPFRLEYRLQRFDGEYRWVLDTGIPRWESDGTFAGYIGSCVDITDRKQAESELHETHVELSRVARLAALGEFAASIAHEVRQPLTAIIMNARSCLRGISRPTPDLIEVRSGLLDVVESCLRADEVIKRNRELFQNHAVKTVPLDINAVIRETLLLARARLIDSQVTVAPNLGSPLPVIDGDAIELQQVLLNLISNAIDAMDRIDTGSRLIEVYSSLDGMGSIKVSVKDYGVGLRNVDADRMFELSYTTKPTGTGVGLSISRSIVEAHGGTLWAEQNAEGGATFSFTLPTHSSVAAMPAEAAYAQVAS